MKERPRRRACGQRCRARSLPDDDSDDFAERCVEPEAMWPPRRALTPARDPDGAPPARWDGGLARRLVGTTSHARGSALPAWPRAARMRPFRSSSEPPQDWRHGFIAKPKHQIASLCPPCSPFSVTPDPRFVHVPIGFIDESAFCTAEVNDERSIRMLAPKLQSSQDTIPEHSPRHGIRECLPRAQLPRAGTVEAMAFVEPFHERSIAGRERA